MKIAFYEVKEEEKTFFQINLQAHELFFFEDTIQEVLTQSVDYDIVSVFVHSRISNDLLDKLPQLRYIQTRSTGFDHIKCTQLYARSLKASNVVGYAGAAVAEFAFSLLLNATRKTHTALKNRTITLPYLPKYHSL